jgi:hypothetical protein
MGFVNTHFIECSSDPARRRWREPQRVAPGSMANTSRKPRCAPWIEWSFLVGQAVAVGHPAGLANWRVRKTVLVHDPAHHQAVRGGQRLAPPPGIDAGALHQRHIRRRDDDCVIRLRDREPILYRMPVGGRARHLV